LSQTVAAQPTSFAKLVTADNTTNTDTIYRHKTKQKKTTQPQNTEVKTNYMPYTKVANRIII